MRAGKLYVNVRIILSLQTSAQNPKKDDIFIDIIKVQGLRYTLQSFAVLILRGCFSSAET